jgi:hypothetical protein
MENSVEKNTSAILLFIKRKRLLKNGEARILMRITVKGEKVKDISQNLAGSKFQL